MNIIAEDLYYAPARKMISKMTAEELRPVLLMMVKMQQTERLEHEMQLEMLAPRRKKGWWQR